MGAAGSIRRISEKILNSLPVAFGQKMYETHRGLQHDYQVSCAELDFLVDATVGDKRVIGARMMGGGFGGCTILLVKADAVAAFSGEISAPRG